MWRSHTGVCHVGGLSCGWSVIGQFLIVMVNVAVSHMGLSCGWSVIGWFVIGMVNVVVSHRGLSYRWSVIGQFLIVMVNVTASQGLASLIGLSLSRG